MIIKISQPKPEEVVQSRGTWVIHVTPIASDLQVIIESSLMQCVL